MKKGILNLQKLKEFCVKYRMALGLGVMTILLFFCNLWFPMWLISGAFILAFMFTCSVAENFAVIMYLELYSGLYGQYVIGIGAGLLALIVRYIIEVKKGTKKLYKFPLIITSAIAVIGSCINYSFNTLGFYSGASFIYMLYLIYFVYIYYKEIDIAKCFNYLLLGMIVTTGLGIIAHQIPTFAISMSYFDSNYHRLKLFTMHMNFLSMLCVFEVVYSIYSLFHRKRPVWLDIFAILVSVILGLLTLSKAFVLLMIFFILYSIVCLIIKFKIKSIIYIMAIGSVLGILCLCFQSYLADIYSRFFIYINFGTSLVSQITTGRSGIWWMYWTEISSSPLKLLFGVGFFSTDIVDIGPHNVPIFLLYRFGIVGILALIVLFASYIKLGKPWYKIRLDNFLMSFTWLILSLEEVVLSDKYLFFLIFGIIMMMKEQVDPKGYNEAIERDRLALEGQLAESQPEIQTNHTEDKKENQTENKTENQDILKQDVQVEEVVEKQTKNKASTKPKTETKKYIVKSKKSTKK